MIELEEAQKQILFAIKPLDAVRTPLMDAAGRFPSQTIESPLDLPLFDNSAMDGYAVLATDVVSATETAPVSLRLIGSVAAGSTFEGGLSAGTCVRLFTGSPMPMGADAVVMQEDTRVDSSSSEIVWICDRVKPWENIRLRGEDVKKGTVLVKTGERLTFGRISLLAATGCAEVQTIRKPIVGLIATGSELREAGHPLNPGEIYESNRAGLSVVASSAGAIPKIYPTVRDTPEATEKILRHAINECDVVITSGGVSVGEFDFVKSAFETLGGRLAFWKVAIRPGKPFVFGQFGGKCLFGLPGNPVSALVTFLLLARPAILKLQGASDVQLRSQQGVLTEDLINRGDRRHFARVISEEDGTVRSAGLQGSHALGSLAAANGLVDVPPRRTLLSGEKVPVLKWD